MLSWNTIFTLNLLRVAITLAILLYSCMTDWKSRRASNNLWYALGALGILINAYYFFALESGLQNNFLILYVFGVAFISIFVILLFKLRAFGGADAKALIAIAIMFPAYPMLDLFDMIFPVSEGIKSPVFALSVLGNAVLIPLFIILAITIRNLIKVPLSTLKQNPLGFFTGYPLKISQLKGRHIRLIHQYREEDGYIIRKSVYGGKEIDEETLKLLEKWEKQGKIDEVWVTPKLPFLIPITIGFLIAVFYGDLLMQIVSIIIHR